MRINSFISRGKKVLTATGAIIMAAMLLIPNVSVAAASVSSVSITKTSITIKAGQTYKLTAKISPASATNKSLKWTSTNAGIATVNSVGVVTGKKAGKALIRATNINGKRGTCTVTVTSKSSTGSSTGSVPASYFTAANYKKNCGDFYKTVGTTKFSICPSAGDLAIDVDVTGVQQYAAKPLTVKFYKNNVYVKNQSGYFGDISKGAKTDGAGFSVGTYMKNGYAWLTPATYRAEFYADGHLFASVAVKLNEKGFCWANIK